MCLDKTALLDHLVGEREHPWRYVDSERPRCVNVDDKLELRRLQHWQIGRLGALEDAASIGSNLTNHFSLVASIAHQPAGCDIAALRVSRRYPFARGQDGKLHTAGGEESIRTHEQSIGALACKHGKGGIDLSDGRGLEYQGRSSLTAHCTMLSVRSSVS